MMFQIILKGCYYNDQEFQAIVHAMLARTEAKGGPDFQVIEARSLEGLKEEVWKRKPTAEDLI